MVETSNNKWLGQVGLYMFKYKWLGQHGQFVTNGRNHVVKTKHAYRNEAGCLRVYSRMLKNRTTCCRCLASHVNYYNLKHFNCLRMVRHINSYYLQCVAAV